MVLTGRRDDREITFAWSAERRFGVLVVDGELAARVRPGRNGTNRISTEPAARNLRPDWLETTVESLLGGVHGPKQRDSSTSTRGRTAYRGARARSGSTRTPRQTQFQTYAALGAWAGSDQRRLSGLPCALCGEPMIVTAPAAMEDRLVCPICMRTQLSSTALMISLILDRMQEAFRHAGPRLPPKARAGLGEGLELLEQLQEALGGPSSEE